MPVVVLTKSDLCDDLENRLSEVSSIAFGIDILVTTSTEENGYKELFPFISEEKTIAFIGSSGVGKSTLINRLLGKELLKTNGLRNDDKGRHTTCLLYTSRGTSFSGVYPGSVRSMETFPTVKVLVTLSPSVR